MRVSELVEELLNCDQEAVVFIDIDTGTDNPQFYSIDIREPEVKERFNVKGGWGADIEAYSVCLRANSEMVIMEPKG